MVMLVAGIKTIIKAIPKSRHHVGFFRYKAGLRRLINQGDGHNSITTLLPDFFQHDFVFCVLTVFFDHTALKY
jgi:hypothetical protein